MENGTTKAFFLSVGGANAITTFAMRALDRTGVPVPGADANGQSGVIKGAPGLLRLRVEAVSEDDWRSRFQVFIKEWANAVFTSPRMRVARVGLEHDDLVFLTRECIEIAEGYMRRDLWDDNLVGKYVAGTKKDINFRGVFWEIVARRMREAAPQKILGLSRERVYRFFKANRARIDILSDPLRPPPTSPRALFEKLAERIGETDVNSIQDDVDRYLQACGRGPESILDLGEADFFDQVADDPFQTDSLGGRVDGRSTATYSGDLARIVRGGIRPTAQLPELEVVQNLLKSCLDRLKELDPEAYEAVRRFMTPEPPDTDDPLGLVFAEGRRQLFWCIHNKIR